MDSIDSVNKVSKEENIISSSKKGLFSQQDANTYDLNDALEFCSGKFSGSLFHKHIIIHM